MSGIEVPLVDKMDDHIRGVVELSGSIYNTNPEIGIRQSIYLANKSLCAEDLVGFIDGRSSPMDVAIGFASSLAMAKIINSNSDLADRLEGRIRAERHFKMSLEMIK